MLKFWIDVGGTFTDCLSLDAMGRERTTKVLSSGVVPGNWPADAQLGEFLDLRLAGFGVNFFLNYELQLIDGAGSKLAARRVVAYDDDCGRIRWESPLQRESLAQAARYELRSGEPAPILAIRKILGLPLSEELPPMSMALGTTRGTNALLTRSGAQVGLLITKGFGDLLEIGEQDRPRLFDLTIQKPPPLYAAVLEVAERMTAAGQPLQVPTRDRVIAGLRGLKSRGIESIAIALLHGFRFPQHEAMIAAWANEVGFAEISVSHQVAPMIKIVPRAETTVLDAYLNPVIRSYAAQLKSRLNEGCQIEFMASHGGLVPTAQFTGKDSVLSGPAGGVVGFARIAEQVGIQRAIGFDMGGTSTDVARYAGHFELDYETRKAGVRIVAPIVAVETVAAGGGSICGFNGTQFTVGPASAGADPGPACYGRGGPLTITDVNLFLGRLSTRQFPFPLDRDAVRRRLTALQTDVRQATGQGLSLFEIANGLREIANRSMASAVHAVSVARGFDPRQESLVAFGGAGPQHVTQVAELLGIKRVLVHPRGSILSAMGIRLADRRVHRTRPVMAIADSAALNDVQETLRQLGQQASAELQRASPDVVALMVEFSLSLRYAGTEAYLTVATPPDGNYLRQFHADHQRLYGYCQDRPIEIVAARAEAIAAGERLLRRDPPPRFRLASPIDHQMLADADELRPIPLYAWDALQPGERLVGPAVVVDDMTTVFVDSGWQADVWHDRQLVIEDLQISSAATAAAVRPLAEPSRSADPIQLEIYNHRFMSIARDMGMTLQRTAVSVNIRDRLDFSCALFNAEGELVVNAPHIPVHLGAMSETVREIIRSQPDAQAGDAFLTNDPFRGGSHLPDVTAVTPVFVEGRTTPSFWVASRGHHAEIGGKTPGSMPPDATCLADEGVVIPPIKLVSAGQERFAQLESLLAAPPYPSRARGDNLADIRAQLAANQRGLIRLQELVAAQSLNEVTQYMSWVQDAAEEQVKSALLRIADGHYSFSDSMDNGARIRVAIEKQGDQLSIDFGGSSPVLPDNLNANRAIVMAAIMYVMRCLLGSNIPLNQGVLRPVKLRLPVCFLNPLPGADPKTSPAVVGGNVETSQRIVDCLLGGLQLAAASQGTMNNWLIGNERFGYYETIGGGGGATAFGPGADAIHTHMSNTRLTDIEVLETRYPLRAIRLAVRRGSGGRGRHRGGDGIVRSIEFLAPVTVSLLGSRRSEGPYGMSGGEPGQPAINRLRRVDGTEHILPFRIQFEAHQGDMLTIETPGGGGWGAP